MAFSSVVYIYTTKGVSSYFVAMKYSVPFY